MSDEHDRHLRRLFVSSEQPYDASEFVTRLSSRLRRARALRQLALLGVMLGVALWFAPWLRGGLQGVARLGDWLIAPAGWLCSLALAGIVLVRSRAFRR